MTLREDPAELRRFAARLTAVARDTVPAHNYLGRYSDPVINTAYLGMFTPVFGGTRKLAQIVSAVIERAATLSDNSATELEHAATMYQRTNHEIAQKLDDTY